MTRLSSSKFTLGLSFDMHVLITLLVLNTNVVCQHFSIHENTSTIHFIYGQMFQKVSKHLPLIINKYFTPIMLMNDVSSLQSIYTYNDLRPPQKLFLTQMQSITNSSYTSQVRLPVFCQSNLQHSQHVCVFFINIILFYFLLLIISITPPIYVQIN